MSDFAIKLTHASKKYTLHHEKPTFVENIFSRAKKEEFWALQDINLTIKKGERIGVIGPNGSGKTTLLEIIAGITTPTHGEVVTNGKLVSLIELEAGFHPDLTGEENIFLNGLLIGMSKKEIKIKLKDITDFAGIGGFFDTPFYTYSSGMKLRLGFSVLAHSSPDILLIDENIAVGDKDFQERSYQKIVDFSDEKKTIIIVSHRLEILNRLTTKTIRLEQGKVERFGPSKKVIKEYLRS